VCFLWERRVWELDANGLLLSGRRISATYLWYSSIRRVGTPEHAIRILSLHSSIVVVRTTTSAPISTVSVETRAFQKIMVQEVGFQLLALDIAYPRSE
jgi:hypothetical protein